MFIFFRFEILSPHIQVTRINSYFNRFIRKFFRFFFIVAIIPGPLAIVAFYGGTQGVIPFLAGLLGQLCGLIIVSNLIATLGVSSGITNQPWFLPMAALALIWLGVRIITADKKGRPKDSLTFASTFLMAAANPKAPRMQSNRSQAIWSR